MFSDYCGDLTMSTPAPFCDTCGQFMHKKFGDVPLIQTRPDVGGLIPEAIWNGDHYQCPNCSGRITLTRSLRVREGMDGFTRSLLFALTEQVVRIQGADWDTFCRVTLSPVDKGTEADT